MNRYALEDESVEARDQSASEGVVLHGCGGEARYGLMSCLLTIAVLRDVYLPVLEMGVVGHGCRCEARYSLMSRLLTIAVPRDVICRCLKWVSSPLDDMEVNNSIF